MYIARIAIAKLLDTKQSNVRHTKQIEDRIKVKLWNSKEPVFIAVDEYQKCFDDIYKGKNKNNSLNFGLVTVFVGIITIVTGYCMNTTVSSNGNEYHNLGLMHERSNTIQLGGIILVAGTLVYCLKKD